MWYNIGRKQTSGDLHKDLRFYSEFINMTKAERQFKDYRDVVMYKGLFSNSDLLALGKAAAESPSIKIKPVPTEIEHMLYKKNQETGSEKRFFEGSPAGTSRVEIIRNDGRRDLGLTVFWGNLDHELNHPSRRRTPVREKPINTPVRNRSRI